MGSSSQSYYLQPLGGLLLEINRSIAWPSLSLALSNLPFQTKLSLSLWPIVHLCCVRAQSVINAWHKKKVERKKIRSKRDEKGKHQKGEKRRETHSLRKRLFPQALAFYQQNTALHHLCLSRRTFSLLLWPQLPDLPDFCCVMLTACLRFGRKQTFPQGNPRIY